ncbi:Na(+)/H(+) antiporter subunit C [Hoyosella rhizosphaerae]|uniref:NADH-ubiquinone oxidoreductase, chain 4L n=1 Tax=Hoyosella rhizosphaerae TaxID=1755582 RepID=A0A916U866_9ACTN|nr:Na(+)/H(+) antiporter subunit C [Hoyosella rhizosphaerae]MBN4927782.1 Na(+)/H(+) antiporter subunit C [Hoyosella rhizosphaerae]GGC61576.1 NADH-ubiquinone oxidoreductase, chain 4L precursor [Hoyosella rhizosphaerae]
MTTSLGMLIIIGVLFGCGVYLVMERSILKALLGLLLMTNAVNLLMLSMGGLSGAPPVVGRESDVHTEMADPLVQALVLTAIVIGMGLAAFVVALIYRSFTLKTREEIEDDDDDIQVAHRTRSEAPDFEPSAQRQPQVSDDPLSPPTDGSDSDFDATERGGGNQ